MKGAGREQKPNELGAILDEGCRHLALSYSADHDGEYRNDHRNAAKAFEMVVRLAPDHHRAWVLLGECRLVLSQNKEAVAAAAYRKAFRSNPPSKDMFYLRYEWFLDGLARFEEARVAFEEAIRRRRDKALARYLAASAYRAANCPEEPLRCWEELIGLTPRDLRAWFERPRRSCT